MGRQSGLLLTFDASSGFLSRQGRPPLQLIRSPSTRKRIDTGTEVTLSTETSVRTCMRVYVDGCHESIG